jgi:hypothetical protein
VDILEIGAELLKANPELSVPEDQEESVLAELRTHLADIEQELRRDQEELDAIRSRTPRNVMPLLLVSSAALVTFLALMVITVFRWPWDLSAYRAWWFLAGPLLVGAELASVVRFRNVQRTVMAHARDEQAALGGLRIQAQTEVTRHLRHILNERAGMESDLGSTLLTEEAPALVEIDAYTKPVPSSTYNRLKRFIQEHDTSAVGLAGPRGVGKSTAMHALQHDTELNCVPIYVNAPVVYAAPDLIRLIDRKLIGEILGPTASDPTDPRWFRRSREEWLLRRVAGGARSIWAWVVIAAIVVLIVDQTRQAAATAAQEAANKHPLSLAAMAFIGMGVIGGLYAAFRPSTADKRPKLPHRNPTLVQSVAFDRLTRLHWASSVDRRTRRGPSVGFGARRGAAGVPAGGSAYVAAVHSAQRRPAHRAGRGRRAGSLDAGVRTAGGDPAHRALAGLGTGDVIAGAGVRRGGPSSPPAPDRDRTRAHRPGPRRTDRGNRCGT